MAKDVVFRIKQERYLPRYVHVIVEAKNGHAWLSGLMFPSEWEAFRSLLMPSAKADFELVEEDLCQTKPLK